MIAPDMAGPWTTIRTNVFSGTYQLDDNIISGRFNQTIVPAEYHYQRVYVSGEIGPNRTGFGGWGNPAITCPPCATTFSDVHFSDYFYTAVTYLACQNVITGYADGTFRPFNNTTRGQLSKIVVLAMGWTQECSTQHFSDVPPSDPFYCYVETAYGHEIISGYADGTFRPGNNVTRGQLSKIVVLAMGWTQTCNTQHFSDVPPGDPFFCYVETALAHGVVAGYADGTFRPGNSATRGQISVIVYRALGNS
jgi:hypothetical protein